MLLRQEGVEKEARDEDGNAPLHVAAENQQTLTVQILLDSGCPTDPENTVKLLTSPSDVISGVARGGRFTLPPH